MFWLSGTWLNFSKHYFHAMLKLKEEQPVSINRALAKVSIFVWVLVASLMWLPVFLVFGYMLT